MSEAPEKIWIYGKQWQETPDFYPRTFESDKPMVSTKSYIRADIVDELVESLQKCWMVMNSGGTWTLEDQDKTKAALKKLEESHE